MTRDDAITIVGMIANSWPGQTWEDDRLEAYVNAIITWDAEVTTRAVARSVTKLKYRPSIAELLEFVQIERRSKLSDREQADLMFAEKPAKPLWVARWERARKEGDLRPFPEQIPGIEAICRMSAENFKVYQPPSASLNDRSAWVGPDEYAA